MLACNAIPLYKEKEKGQENQKEKQKKQKTNLSKINYYIIPIYYT